MTRRLILIRHAKSGWDDPMADDHARTLTDRGQEAAKAIGAWLEGNGYIPDLILCSDATRTAQTCTHIGRAFTTKPALRFVPALYHAAPDTIAALASAETAPTIAIIGHNPGIGMLAHALVQHRPNHARFSDYPTCATTVIDFADDKWLKIGAGHTTAFVVPRDLS